MSIFAAPYLNLALPFLLLALASCSESSLDSPPTAGIGGVSSVGGASAGTGGQVLGADVSAVFGTGGTSSAGGSSAIGSGGESIPAFGGSTGGAASGGVGFVSGGAEDTAAGGAEVTGTGGSGSIGAGGTKDQSGPLLPPVSSYSEKGPFLTVVDESVGPDGGYIVYRPESLGEDSFLHAPIVFGPGIGQTVGVHTEMLTHFASHGFVVVGTPVLNGGPGDAANRDKMQKGLDWILEENSKPGLYEGKIWVDHAVSMGFSVGGTAAVELGGDESVLTVVSIHGHTATTKLNGTLLQTTGTGDTVGLPLQQNTYETSRVPTFLATLTGASHGYIEQAGGGEERPAILAWMRYWIYGDTGAEHFFFGDECTLCTAPWENPQRKNWD